LNGCDAAGLSLFFGLVAIAGGVRWPIELAEKNT